MPRHQSQAQIRSAGRKVNCCPRRNFLGDDGMASRGPLAGAGLGITISSRVRKGETVMKTFISIFAVTLALAFTVPAFGGDKETADQCQKDGGTWDAKTKHCSGKY
jgi:hypothetical protein